MLQVIERLNALCCDPIEGMAQVAIDAAAPVEVRARMVAEPTQYVAPKRQAIEQEVGADTAAALAGRVTVYLPSNGREPEP